MPLLPLWLVCFPANRYNIVENAIRTLLAAQAMQLWADFRLVSIVTFALSKLFHLCTVLGFYDLLGKLALDHHMPPWMENHCPWFLHVSYFPFSFSIIHTTPWQQASKYSDCGSSTEWPWQQASTLIVVHLLNDHADTHPHIGYIAVVSGVN